MLVLKFVIWLPRFWITFWQFVILFVKLLIFLPYSAIVWTTLTMVFTKLPILVLCLAILALFAVIFDSVALAYADLVPICVVIEAILAFAAATAQALKGQAPEAAANCAFAEAS